MTNTADRMDNLAARYSRDELVGFLFSAYQCDDAPDGQLGCPPSDAVTATADGFGGTLYERTSSSSTPTDIRS